MRFLPLLLLPFLATPAFAARFGPGTQVEAVRINSTSARILVRNPGGMRGKFTVGAYDVTTGEQVPAVVSPSSFSLAPRRSRKVRFTQLPNQDLLLCATVEVSPALDLRSCVFSEQR